MLSGLQEKQLSIEYNIVQADGSTPIKEINAWFFLRKKMVEQKKGGHGAASGDKMDNNCHIPIIIDGDV